MAIFVTDKSIKADKKLSAAKRKCLKALAVLTEASSNYVIANKELEKALVEHEKFNRENPRG